MRSAPQPPCPLGRADTVGALLHAGEVSPTVFIAEPDPLAARALARLVAAMGFRVVEAGHPADVVIARDACTDWIPPDLEGRPRLLLCPAGAPRGTAPGEYLSYPCETGDLSMALGRVLARGAAPDSMLSLLPRGRGR